MKAFAVRAGFGLDQLGFIDLPEPSSGPGQVLVRVRAASLNFRDLLLAKGQYNPRLKLPRVLGSDAAGECGRQVHEWESGGLGLRAGPQVHQAAGVGADEDVRPSGARELVVGHRDRDLRLADRERAARPAGAPRQPHGPPRPPQPEPAGRRRRRWRWRRIHAGIR